MKRKLKPFSFTQPQQLRFVGCHLENPENHFDHMGYSGEFVCDIIEWPVDSRLLRVAPIDGKYKGVSLTAVAVNEEWDFV